MVRPSPRASCLLAIALLATTAVSPPTEAQTGGLDATFREPSGNAWWVQVYVDAERDLAGVDARVDGGAWKPLALRSWGAWAENHHAPEGSLVQFRATATDGSLALSGCYLWTAATPADCPGDGDPAPANATFDHRGGNAWWVEVRVAPAPDAVEAMDTDGDWRALSLRDWGDWAGSFHIEPGHDVRFRARLDGAWQESCWHTHPAGAPLCDAPPEDADAPPLAAGSRRVVVLGDTGTGENAQRNVQGSLDDDASGFLGTGDYYYWDPPERWTEVFAPLLEKEHHLVRGNHDDPHQLPGHFPNGTTWSVHMAGARVVGLDSTRSIHNGSAQHTFARHELCQASEPLRVLVAHHNWWLESGARHPGTEFPGGPSTMEALVDDCGVDLVLVGHEHNYQRLVRGNVTYVIMGAGGQSLYPVEGSPDGTVSSASAYGRVLLDVNASGFIGRFRTVDGRTLDAFEGSAHAQHPGAPPAPEASFDHRGGNEWWVEAAIDPHPQAVEAMDANGEWHPLTFRSWGTWAGSFHIEPGNDVRFRASDGGDWTTSCWFTHPGGEPLCDGPAPPADDATFDARFTPRNGNEWWIQAKVEANEPLASVDARIDGGAWRPLELKSWGDWAASYHAPDGAQVKFRATSTEGSTEVSTTYTWPQ